MRANLLKAFNLFLVFALVLGVNIAMATPNNSQEPPTNHIQSSHERLTNLTSSDLSGVKPPSVI